MKTRNLLLLLTLLVVTVSVQAQLSVNVNVGTPPVWAPSAPVGVKYYYIPDIETYYNVPAKRYIYLRNGKWHRSAALPAHYRSYNLRTGRTIFLTDYKGKTPYSLYKVHKVKYKGNGKWKNKSNFKSNSANKKFKPQGNVSKAKSKGNGKGKEKEKK